MHRGALFQVYRMAILQLRIAEFGLRQETNRNRKSEIRNKGSLEECGTAQVE